MQQEITKDRLFRYFRGEASRAEVAMIDLWLGEDAAHRRQYKAARAEFEMLMMYGDSAGVKDGAYGKASGRKKTVRIALRVVLNAAAVAAFFLAASWAAEYRVDRRLETEPVSVSVPAGQRMNLTLADGTSVELNAGARLVYPALFKGKERNVHLEGEAVFHVTHDESRPFNVNTYAARVQVLGTDFNVLADSETGEFSTTLIDGRVKVSKNDDAAVSVTLQPDQKVSIMGGKLYVESVAASEEVLWTEGILDIGNMDFGRLIRQIERTYGVDVIIERQEMPSIDCTSGKIRVAEGIDHIMHVLSLLSDFTYSIDTRTGTVYIR